MRFVIGTEPKASLMVKRLEKKTARTGNEYLSGEVFDKGGVYATVVWNPDLCDRDPRPGDVVEGAWKVRDFNGKAQLDLVQIYALVRAENVLDSTNFVRQSHVTREVWLAYYNAEVRPLLDNREIETLLDEVLTLEPRFFTAPAAKSLHQNWRGGLAEHTHRMLRLFVSMLHSGHPSMQSCSRALVVAGIILHDFGKVMEYEEPAPGQYEIGEWGALLGHLAGAPLYLSALMGQRPSSVDPKTFTHLMHVLLSHHGQVEWGSPVVPATPEALLVHMIDNLDGKLSMMEEATDGQLCKGLSTRVYHYI